MTCWPNSPVWCVKQCNKVRLAEVTFNAQTQNLKDPHRLTCFLGARPTSFSVGQLRFRPTFRPMRGTASQWRHKANIEGVKGGEKIEFPFDWKYPSRPFVVCAGIEIAANRAIPFAGNNWSPFVSSLTWYGLILNRPASSRSILIPHLADTKACRGGPPTRTNTDITRHQSALPNKGREGEK